MNRKGFTLIELLVVMAILGLMIALAPMVGRNVLPSLQAKANAQEIAATLKVARAEAIRDNLPAAVVFDVAERRYGLAGREATAELGAKVEMKVVTASREVIEDGVGQIVFYPDGASTGGLVTLVANGESYEVSVDWFTGRVSLVN